MAGVKSNTNLAKGDILYWELNTNLASGDLVCREMGLNTKLGNCDLLYEGFKHKGKRRHPVYGVETNLENGDFCTGGQTQNKLASDDLLYGGSN